MAHCSCLNGHSMWNGDGKPLVEVFRVDYILSYSHRHPECILGSSTGFELYDCFRDDPKEELDCWYCDECHSLAIFIDSENLRYDFETMPDGTAVSQADVVGWEKYYALREKDFEAYSDFYEGMNPAEAIEKYLFPYEYRVSPDRMWIFAFDRHGTFCFGFKQKHVVRLKK